MGVIYYPILYSMLWPNLWTTTYSENVIYRHYGADNGKQVIFTTSTWSRFVCWNIIHVLSVFGLLCLYFVYYIVKLGSVPAHREHLTLICLIYIPQFSDLNESNTLSREFEYIIGWFIQTIKSRNVKCSHLERMLVDLQFLLQFKIFACITNLVINVFVFLQPATPYDRVLFTVSFPFTKKLCTNV